MGEALVEQKIVRALVAYKLQKFEQRSGSTSDFGRRGEICVRHCIALMTTSKAIASRWWLVRLLRPGGPWR
jgi:hypothetical protein